MVLNLRESDFTYDLLDTFTSQLTVENWRKGVTVDGKYIDFNDIIKLRKIPRKTLKEVQLSFL